VKIYKIDIENGKIQCYNENCLKKEYRIYTLYNLCDMVWAFRLSNEQLLLNVLTREKLIPIIDYYIQYIIQIIRETNHQEESERIELFGRPFLYSAIQVIAKRKLEKLGFKEGNILFNIDKWKEEIIVSTRI